MFSSDKQACNHFLTLCFQVRKLIAGSIIDICSVAEKKKKKKRKGEAVGYPQQWEGSLKAADIVSTPMKW